MRRWASSSERPHVEEHLPSPGPLGGRDLVLDALRRPAAAALCRRCCCPAAPLLQRAIEKPRKLPSEYWYMVLMLCRGCRQKKRREPASAKGRKTLRCRSSSSAAFSEPSSDAWISVALDLAARSDSSRAVLSRMLPVDVARALRRSVLRDGCGVGGGA